jgi:hypothetical protein
MISFCRSVTNLRPDQMVGTKQPYVHTYVSAYLVILLSRVTSTLGGVIYGLEVDMRYIVHLK